MYAFTSSPSHTPCIQVDASHPLLISNSSRQLLLLELSLVYCVALRPVAVEFVLKLRHLSRAKVLHLILEHKSISDAIGHFS